jgi:hypothetical protein
MDSRVFFRNFTGKAGPYNEEGSRSFAVEIDPENVDDLVSAGWNVKFPKERDMEEGEEDTRLPFIKVTVSYRNRPPRVVLITDKAKTNLHEDSVEMLDWADIDSCDMILSPYVWSQPDGSSGVTAYLSSIYVNINQDELEKKYDTMFEGGEPE